MSEMDIRGNPESAYGQIHAPVISEPRHPALPVANVGNEIRRRRLGFRFPYDVGILMIDVSKHSFRIAPSPRTARTCKTRNSRT